MQEEELALSLFQLVKKCMLICCMLSLLIFAVSCVETNVFSEWPTGTWENDSLYLDFDHNMGRFIEDDGTKLYIAEDHGTYKIYIYYRENNDDVIVFRGEYRIDKDKDTLSLISNNRVVYELKRTNSDTLDYINYREKTFITR